MENLKDGRLFSEKYEPRIKRFKPPHKFVFANRWPDFSKLSLDRWVLMDLTMDEPEFEDWPNFTIRTGIHANNITQ